MNINKFISSKIFTILFTVFVLSILVMLAYQKSWNFHLSVDIWGFYYPRFIYFTKNLSFGGYGENEYLPGAMLFFLLPGIFFTILQSNWQNYLLGLIIINLILICTHLYIYRKHFLVSPIIFLMILLASGPLILFRHDLYVSLFIIGSIVFWNKEKKYLSLFILGLATVIKVFPAIIFPVFAIFVYIQNGWTALFKCIFIFMVGMFSLIAVYLIFGSSTEILSALTVNSIKPVHVESLWGSILTIIGRLRFGYWQPGLGAHGIFGIDPKNIYLPLNFYNYFWILPLTFYYALILINAEKLKLKIAQVCFLAILLFELFSKILTPQYLFWFLPIIPIFNWKIENNKILIMSLVITFCIVFITQYIYPLHYNELLGGFYVNGTYSLYFYLLLLRNLLLVSLFCLIFKFTFKKEKNEKS